MGSRSTLSCEIDEDDISGDLHWQMNYHEAAIFLEEGQNNEKFDSHPSHPSDLPNYLFTHNRIYYAVDLVASIVLLLLALIEAPSTPYFHVSM